MDIIGKKIHVCKINGCNASFSRPYKLEFHIKRHNGERPYICSVGECSKSYTNPSHLKRHESTAHEQKNIHNEILCKICGHICSNKYNFKKHITKHNESEFPFECSDCAKKFKKKRQLSEHMSFHSGEYPYRCEICSNGFNKIHLLNKHKRNHKTYTCDCGETFPRWTLFCAHRSNVCKIKTIDHKCVICSKIFTTKSNLRMHSMTHVDESQKEMYECPYKNCNRTYHYKKNMKEHIRSFHEKSKVKLELNCTEPGCQTFVSTYANLKRHLIQVHKTKFKKEKKRKIRSDAGKSKESIAASLSGISVNKELKDLSEKQNLPELQETSSCVNDSKKLTEDAGNVLKVSNCETENILVVNCEILDATSNIIPNDANSIKSLEFSSTCSNMLSEIQSKQINK